MHLLDAYVYTHLPDPDTIDEFVAWLETDTSLIEPNHFNVSDDDVLSELLLSTAALILLTDEVDCRSDWDQCDDLDSISLSCRNLQIERDSQRA